MGKRTRRYEVEFTTCLLVVGPLPDLHDNDTAHFKYDVRQVREHYKRAVMQWWVDWHGQIDTPPTGKSQFKFYRKFRTWQKVNLRRQDRD